MTKASKSLERLNEMYNYYNSPLWYITKAIDLVKESQSLEGSEWEEVEKEVIEILNISHILLIHYQDESKRS